MTKTNNFPKDEFLRVINEDRECDCFTEWQQGYSPREHAEMMMNEATLKIQRDESEADRNWRERQARRDHQWRRSEAKWRQRELLVMGVIVTLVSVAAQIVSAFIERGDLFKSNTPKANQKTAE